MSSFLVFCLCATLTASFTSLYLIGECVCFVFPLFISHHSLHLSHGQDTEFTSCFVNALSIYNVGRSGEAMNIFYDAFSLEEGKQFDIAFMKALSQTLVVVPFITAAALQRMCEAGSVNNIDHVLLEWWLAYSLLKAGQGRVKAILPVVCGEVSWGWKRCKP